MLAFQPSSPPRTKANGVAAVDEAIDLVQLTEIVGSLPNGLETTVGERSVRFSDGDMDQIPREYASSFLRRDH